MNKLLTGTVLIGLFILGYGLFKNQFILDSYWSDPVTVGLIACGSFFLGFLLRFWYLAILIVFACYEKGLIVVGTILILLISSTIIGNRLLYRENNSNRLYSLISGLAIYSLIIGLLAHTTYNTIYLYSTILLLPLLFCRKKLFSFANINIIQPRSLIDRLYFSFVCVSLTLIFVQVLRPETMHDALYTHLRVPAEIKYFLTYHFNLNEHLYALIPLGANWLYALVYVVAGEYSVRLLNATFLVLTQAVIWDLTKRFTDIRSAWATVALFSSMSLTYLVTVSLFVENFWALMIIAGFSTLIRLKNCVDRNELIKMSLFFGTALATKVTTVFLLLPCGIVYLIKFFIAKKKNYNSELKNLVLPLLVFIITGGYQYFYAYSKSGNPFFPFFNGFFKSPYFDSTSNFNNAIWNQPINLRLIYDITFHSDRFLESSVGSFCFHVLVFSIPLLIISRYSNCLIIVFTTTLSWFLIFKFQSYSRYIYPTLAILHVGIGMVIFRLPKYFTPVIVIILVALNTWFFPASTWFYRDIPENEILSNQHKATLTTKSPERLIVNYLNHLGKDFTKERVFFLHGAMIGEFHGMPLMENWYSNKFFGKFNNATNSRQLRNLMKEYSVKYIVVGNSPPSRIEVKEFLESYATLIYKVGHGQLYKLINHKDTKVNLLNNSQFSQNLTSWSVMGEVKSDQDGGILVSSQNFISQPVLVVSNNFYSIKVTALCLIPNTQFRLQVAWKDASGKDLGVFIKTESCTREYVQYKDIIEAPSEASVAVVFATGHEGTNYIKIKNIHFGKY
jgi:hypothetical protein